MEEVVEDKKNKYSLVTGKKIKNKSVRKIKKEHKKSLKLEKKEDKKTEKKKRKIDKKLKNTSGVTVESVTLSNNDVSVVLKENVDKNVLKKNNMEESEGKEKVLIVRKIEKSKPLTKKRKVLNFLSYALVGLVAVFFGYFSGNLYIANVLNKVDYGAFVEADLRDDSAEVYGRVTAGNITSFKAGELFIAAEHALGLRDNFYATSTGVIQPSIGSKQIIWGFKSKAGKIWESENVSKGMMSVGERYYYNEETGVTNVYKATKYGDMSAEFSGTSVDYNYDDYRAEYGTAPNGGVVPYIVSSKTVVAGTEKVESIGGGKYKLTFDLTTDSSVINYIKQVKHMSGLADYPTFKNIMVTAVIDSDLKFISLRYDESYTVVYFGVMATCSGYVENVFTY